jgi:transposase
MSPHLQGRDIVMDDSLVCVGIDVAKAHLDVHVLPTNKAARYRNSKAGIAALVKMLKSHLPDLVVLEATGKLEIPAASALDAAGMRVAIVNPRQVRDFAKATGQLAKTDALDAKVIATYGRAVHPEPRPIPDKETPALQGVLARRRQLIQMLTAEKNRLDRAHPVARRDVREHIGWLYERLERVDAELHDRIKGSPAWREREELLRSVPGVGPVASRTFLIDLPELGSIDKKAISKLVGVAPLNHDSGAMRGTRTTWGGRPQVRCLLYMASLAAIRSNPVIRAHYRKLRDAGKRPKVAQVACMRKLLVILNAIAASGTPWEDQSLT